MASKNLDRYRPNVGVALFNDDGLVFIGKRAGERSRYCWQMPQGGVDPGEDERDAAVRELEEETGVRSRHIEPLAEIDHWLTYDFPTAVRLAKRRRGKNWRGQKQRWFAFRFTGKAGDVDLNAHHKPEFDDWRWERLAATPELIIPWKRRVYVEVAKAFAPFAEH